MTRLLDAASSYGWALALVVALAAFGFAWQGANPIEEVHDHIAVPVAQSVGILSAEDCDTASDGDVRVPYCFRDGFIVYKNSEGEETHAMPVEGGPFVFPGDEDYPR